MKLSIITITMNCESAVRKTIESVLNQETPIYEYLFIDGGSQDRTNEVIDSYKGKLEAIGIRVVHISEKDKGISDAFNKGIRLATGEWIGIINADDQLLPETTGLLEIHSRENDCDIIYGNCIWDDEKNGLRYVKKPKGDLSRLYYDFVLIHPSTFVRRSMYEEHGLFNIEYKLCMDKELLLRMYVGGARFSYLDRELTNFAAGGASDQNVVRTVKEGIKLSNAYNRPKAYTYVNAARKIIKHKLSVLLKRSRIYGVVKQLH